MIEEKRLLTEIISIADELLNEVQKTENGWYWETVSIDYDEDSDYDLVWDVSESLYSGTGGIVFFFLELYKKTGEEKYLNVAGKGSRWLVWYCANNPTDYYAFFTGRMGISYLFLQFYNLTDNKEYLNTALTIAKDCDKFLENRYTVNDLINGISGTLLGLLHLHEISKEGWVLEKISSFTKHLLSEIKNAEKGIYWDLDYKHAQPLCGFSHGVSGIGYVFLELGHYFNNDALFIIAEQAFAYENAQYDASNTNWPDFRNGIFDDDSYEESKRAYLNDDLDYFFEPSFMTAWCHGAPGIGFSRSRAYQLLEKEIYKIDLENSIEHTYQVIKSFVEVASYTLCHGKGGDALLFIDTLQKFGDEKYKEYAANIARQSIESHNSLGKYISGYNVEHEQKEDTSLFMGKAGVGYFYLQCLHADDNYTILAPCINDTCKSDVSIPKILDISKSEIKKIMLRDAFPRTIKIISEKWSNEWSKFLDLPLGALDHKKQFKGFVKNLSAKVKKKDYRRIEDLFGLELKRFNLKVDTNPAYLHIQDDIQLNAAGRLLEMSDEELLKQELTLNNTITFYATKWNWNETKRETLSENFENPADSFVNMYYRKKHKIVEFPALSSFTYTVFNSFTENKSAMAAKKAVCKSLELDKKNSKVIDTITEQVKEGIKARILVVPNQYLKGAN